MTKRIVDDRLIPVHVYYYVSTADSMNGKATHGSVSVRDGISRRWIGETKWFHKASRRVLAYAHARGICVRHFRTMVARDTTQRRFHMHILDA